MPYRMQLFVTGEKGEQPLLPQPLLPVRVVVAAASATAAAAGAAAELELVFAVRGTC